MNDLDRRLRCETFQHRSKDRESPNIGVGARFLASTQTQIATQQSSFLLHQTAKGHSSLRGRPSVLLCRKVDWDYEANGPPFYCRFRVSAARLIVSRVMESFSIL